MKKWKLFAVLLIGILSLMACGNDKSSQLEFDESETASGEDSLNGLEETLLNLADYKLDDENVTFPYSEVAASDTGAYFFDSRKAFYHDYNMNQTIPLCDRPDCLHEDDDCVACVMNPNYIYGTSSLAYYEGFIYFTVCIPETGEVNLGRIAADGSVRDEAYMTLYKQSAIGDASSYGYTEPKYCIHNGYVYFSTSLHENVPKIYRMKLGEDNVEVIYKSSGTRASIYRLQANGDYLFFQSGNFVDDDMGNIEAGIFAYNTKTGEVQLAKKNAINNYSVRNNTLYYGRDTDIYCCALDNGEEKLLVSGVNSARAGWHVIDDTIYIWNRGSGDMTTYNLEGNQIGVLEGEVNASVSWTNRGYLFTKGEEFNKLKLEEFLNGVGEWELIEFETE